MQRTPPIAVADGASSLPSRRDCIRFAGAALAAAALPHAHAQPGGGGSVMQFGADPTGQKDSSDAFKSAFAQFNIVDVPAGNAGSGAEAGAGATQRPSTSTS